MNSMGEKEGLRRSEPDTKLLLYSSLSTCRLLKSLMTSDGAWAGEGNLLLLMSIGRILFVRQRKKILLLCVSVDGSRRTRHRDCLLADGEPP